MTLAELEAAHIIRTLRECGYNRTHTARKLGVGIRTIQRKLMQYGMQHVFTDAGLYACGVLQDEAPSVTAIYEALNDDA
jgi:hypothetical protein